MEQIRNIRALLSAKTPPETRPKKHISRNTQGNALDRLKFQFYGPGRVNHRQDDKVAEIVDKCLTLGVSEEIPAVSLINRARTQEIQYDCTGRKLPPPRGEQWQHHSLKADLKDSRLQNS